MINVEAHAARCRMAGTIIFIGYIATQLKPWHSEMSLAKTCYTPHRSTLLCLRLKLELKLKLNLKLKLKPKLKAKAEAKAKVKAKAKAKS